MRNDIDRARRAGYSDDQILTVLSDDPAQKAEIEGALRGGYSASQVLTVLQEEAGQAKRDAIKGQGWGDYAADLGRAVVYGAGQEAKAVGTSLAAPADAVGAPSTLNQVGTALQGAGALANAQAGGYRPSQFDIMHPIDTASELPKAAAEAVPGLVPTLLAGAGAGAATGAAGGAIAGPAGAAVGAAVGGIGGAAAYAYMRYRGSFAQAHAETQGRSAPTQADFDATQKEALAAAAVDAASMKAGGLVGKAAVPKGTGLRGSASALQRGATTSGALAAGGAVNSVIGQTAAMDETAPGQDSVIGRLGNVDYAEAANAGATGAAVGGLARAARLPADLAGAAKYRAGGPTNKAALTRIVDYMNSDRFPGDPTRKSDTGLNLRMMRGQTQDTLDAFARDPQAVGLDGKAKLSLDEANRFLKAGATFSEAQFDKIRSQIGDNPTVLDAIADRNAVNWMAEKSGQGEGQSRGSRLLTMALRNPGKAGGAAALASEALPILTGAASLATGGKLAAASLGAKGLMKASGFDRVVNDPMGAISDRYGGRVPNDPTAVIPSGARTIADFAALNDAVQRAQPAPAAPPIAPAAPVVPAAAPSHPSLADALGTTAPTRFTPRPSAPLPGGSPSGPVPAPAPTGRSMSISDILTEMKVQAEGERQPLLDVAQLHHRSARAMSSDRNFTDAQRRAAQDEAHAIHEGIIKPLEAEMGGPTDPAVIRARSFRQVDAAPAPEPLISPEGLAAFQAEAPAAVKAVTSAGSEGAARRTIEAFVAKFGPRDRDFVRQSLARNPDVQRATKTVQLRRSIKGTTVLKRAKKSKTKKK